MVDFSYCLLLIEVILEIREVYMDIGSFLSNHIGTIVNAAVAICTLYMAYATQRMAKVTKQTLDEQNKPYVVVYVDQDKNSPYILQIVIENIGNSPAYDIKFDVPNNFYVHMFSTEPIVPNAFKYGITQMVPKQRLRFDWISGHSLDNYKDLCLTVKASFSDVHSGCDTIKSKRKNTTNVIDVNCFYSSCVYDPIEKECVRIFNNINKNMSDIKNIIDRKLTPQSPEATYMWCYVAWRLFDNQYPREYIIRYGKGSGLTREQLKNAEKTALKLLKEYRPDLIKKEDEDFLSSFDPC